MALGLIFGGCIILIYQKMKLQSKNFEILNKQKLRKKIYIYLPLTCFLFRNSLTTIYSRTIISSSSGMSCKSSVSKIAAEFSPFVFLPLSTRAYFKGRAYIKIILKNHARSYFAARSYYRGNTVLAVYYDVKLVPKNMRYLEMGKLGTDLLLNRKSFFPSENAIFKNLSSIVTSPTT